MSSQSSRRFFRYLTTSYKPRQRANKKNNQRTSQATESTTDDTIEKLIDSFSRLCIDTPRCKISGPTNEDKDETTSQPSQLYDTSEKPFRFLDLPTEIRDLVYDFLRPSQCPGLEAVIFTPQVFEDTYPESVSLDIVTWSCRKYAKLLGERKHRSEYENTFEGLMQYVKDDSRWGRICEDEECDQSAKDFTKLTRVNRQIRNEVQKILLSCRGEHESTYSFQTETCPRRAGVPFPEDDTAIQLRGLDRVERRAASRLSLNGVPFAVLKTRTWASSTECINYELLVPAWGGSGVSWRKLRDVKCTEDYYGDRICWCARILAKASFGMSVIEDLGRHE